MSLPPHKKHTYITYIHTYRYIHITYIHTYIHTYMVVGVEVSRQQLQERFT